MKRRAAAAILALGMVTAACSGKRAGQDPVRPYAVETRTQLDWNGSAFVPTLRASYLYDESGRMIGEGLWDLFQGEWVEYYQWSYIYDGDRLVAVVWLELGGGQWTEVDRIALEHDAMGRPVAMQSSTRRFEWRYQTDGLLESDTTLECDQGACSVELEQRFDYTAEGSLSQLTYADASGLDYLRVNYEYAPDGAGLLTGALAWSYDDAYGGWYESNWTHFYYNAEGRLQSIVHESTPPLQNQWTESSRSEYEYVDGRLVAVEASGSYRFEYTHIVEPRRWHLPGDHSPTPWNWSGFTNYGEPLGVRSGL